MPALLYGSPFQIAADEGFRGLGYDNASACYHIDGVRLKRGDLLEMMLLDGTVVRGSFNMGGVPNGLTIIVMATTKAGNMTHHYREFSLPRGTLVRKVTNKKET